MRLTRFTATTPLTKRFSFVDGALTKTAAAQMVAGTAEQVEYADLTAFAAALDALTHHQALSYGVAPGYPSVRIVAQKRHREGDGAITRTRKYFQFAPGAGVMMLDYDPAPGTEALAPEALMEVLRTAAPCLSDASLVWRPSVSSGIYGPDGQELTGIRGQRLYIPVADASQIPAAGKALATLLWAAGHGYILIGAAGQMLARTLVDTAVWQPEHLDFAAPPILDPGLIRRPHPARIIGEPGARYDLHRLIALADGTVRAAADKAQKVARAAHSVEAEKVRDAWIEDTAADLETRTGVTHDAAVKTLRRAAVKHELTGDYSLVADDGKQVTVGELLDHPERWHGKRFGDPLEPDYDRSHRIAWANLRSGGRPYLFSHAHGGRRFALIRPSARIKLAVGERARVVDQLLDLVRTRGELHDYGEGAALARITDDARVQPVTRDWLVDHMERAAQYYVEVEEKDPETGEPVIVQRPKDAPMWAAAAMLSKDGERRLPRLDAVITAPTLRRDGSILNEPGYDAMSRLLLRVDTPEGVYIPPAPTREQARAALDELWAPFRLFPLVDEVDRGVVLAGILTGLVRASLPTAPGYGFDAPSAGSGKTLVALAVGALCLGVAPAALPPASNQDEEARKRLFSALRDGHRVLLWDNVREPLGNGAMDAFLTAPQFSDRILGKSEMATLPNRALFLATGNNLRLVGDTCRRILVARMDPQMERPYGREFNFCPLQTVLGNRLRLVAAGLTIIRAWITAGRPRPGAGRTASFEDWDDLVRQPVCWVAGWDNRFSDPLKATERAFELDPDTAKLAAILAAWHAVAGDKPHTVAQMRAAAATADIQGTAIHPELVDSFQEIAGDNRGNLNPRILGRWIERHADRRVGGLRFVREGVSHKVVLWSVKSEVQPDPKKPPNSPQTPPSGAGPQRAGGFGGFGGFSGTSPDAAQKRPSESFRFQEPAAAGAEEIF